MKNYFCPKCGAEVPLSDINVSSDLMLCKSCGETSSFAEAVNEVGDESVLVKPPPKHLRIETDPMDPERRTTITYKKISPLALFFVPFTCVWAGFSMMGIYGSQIIKGVLELKGGEAKYFAGVFGIGLRKRFHYDCQTKVSRGAATFQQKGQTIEEIQISPSDGSGKIRIFALTDDDALNYILEFLRRAFR